jgi:FecR protein
MYRLGMIQPLVLMVATLLLAAVAVAQPESGTVAAVVGTLQIQRGGTWQEAAIGAPVFPGDRLRTGTNDRAKVVFADDSVLDLAPGTELSITNQVFNPGRRGFRSLLRLFQGKVRAWVSAHYHEPHARYEVETPTAIAGVRGTEFIVVYTVDTELSEIVGIADEVEVSGKLTVIGPSVRVGPHFYTQVEKGRFPTPPVHLDAARFRQFLEGLELVGTGRRDGLEVLHPATEGHLLSAQDVPAAIVPSPPPAPAGLQLGPPQGFLAQVLSPDIATNTQPLLDFERTLPGHSPGGTGNVKVGF